MKRVRKTNSIVTEAQLRRFIRDELSRQRLVQEGILDTIAAPFSKLKEKAKKEVMAQVDKIVAKIKDLINNINENIKGKLSELGFNEFLQAFKSTEGSEDIRGLVDDAGFFKELKELIAAKSELKSESLVLVKNRLVENKIPTHDEIHLAFSLMEKKSSDRSKKLLEINEVYWLLS